VGDPTRKSREVEGTPKTVGCGTLRWYQSPRQAFKLFNKYAGFRWRAGPRVGCARKACAGTVAGGAAEGTAPGMTNRGRPPPGGPALAAEARGKSFFKCSALSPADQKQMQKIRGCALLRVCQRKSSVVRSKLKILFGGARVASLIAGRYRPHH
jgi:hypothetical protein